MIIESILCVSMHRRQFFQEYRSPQQQQGHPPRSEYQVLEEIGRGSFGSVRKVIHIPTKKLLVRKDIKYGHMNSKERQQLIAECSILSQLKHENIVEFYNWDFDEQKKCYTFIWNTVPGVIYPR